MTSHQFHRWERVVNYFEMYYGPRSLWLASPARDMTNIRALGEASSPIVTSKLLVSFCGREVSSGPFPSETTQRRQTHTWITRQSSIMSQQKTQKLGFAENFALSGAAAVISKTAAAPIERIKLMVQNQDEMIKSGRLSEPYKGVIDCTVRTYRTEGILPFWRGNLANCIRYFPTQALNFAFKDKIKSVFKQKKTDHQMVKFGKNIASGGCAGAASLIFVYSLDYARTRLANDAKAAGKGGGERQFNGLIDVYRKTLKSDGIQGLYRGFALSCVGIFVYRGFYFGLYDTLKPLILGEDAGLILSFGLGYMVTITAGLASYPIDTIRRRMMMTSGEAVKYKGSFDCFIQVVKNEGAMSLMKGAGANILRGVAGAGVLAGFDKFKALYISWRLT